MRGPIETFDRPYRGNSTRRHTIVTVCQVLYLASLPAAAGWLRLESPNFECYTDASEKTGRAALERLEETSPFLAAAGFPLPHSHNRVRLVLFSRAGDFARYRRFHTTSAFFQSGPERDLIVAGPAPDLDRALRHELVHQSLVHTRPKLPRWYEEGLAEVLSTVVPARQAWKTALAIPSHQELLQKRTWLPAAELFAFSESDENDPERTRLFYAESWAVVRRAGRIENGRNQLQSLLEAGTPSDKAVAEVWGLPLDQVLSQTRTQLTHDSGRFENVPGRTPPPPPSISAQPAGEIESGAMLVSLALQCGLPQEAARLYQQLASHASDSPAAATAIGLLALDRGDTNEAEKQLRRAAELGSRDATTYFELALLARDIRHDEQETRRRLEQAIEVNPTHPEALFLLGRTWLRAKEPKKAIPYLERATQVLPRQPQFWLELAEAQLQSQQKEAALESARRALASAEEEQDILMARGFLKLSSAPPTASARPSGVVTPKSWDAPRGDADFTGTLTQVDCSAAGLILHITNGSRELLLRAPRPDRIAIYGNNAPREFPCGALPQPPSVRVSYRRGPGNDGELVAIEFR